jgi:polyisoprenoid-binding protein YceI
MMNTHSNHLLSRILAPLAVLALAIGLAACQPKAVRPVTATPQVPASKPTFDTTGATRYVVDSAASDVHILVYRGGAMARLGHNHVVSSKNVSGEVYLHNDLAKSHIELTLPVPSLIVDEPKSRAIEGVDFAAEIPPDAREGTMRNLQRLEVLDGEHFPTITLKSGAISGSRVNPAMIMQVTIKGVTRDVTVLATVREEPNRVTAEGEFAIQQSDFGMTPFSIGLGALQVQDRLRIKFSIVCRKQQ